MAIGVGSVYESEDAGCCCGSERVWFMVVSVFFQVVSGFYMVAEQGWPTGFSCSVRFGYGGCWMI